MQKTAKKGMIADIQHFSLHDGPGIRTTVFLKGCNMHCAWCHNPETISHEPEVLFYPDQCIHCGGCEDECFTGARVVCGRLMSVEDVLADIMQDKPYYGTEGGVTLSGGEPLVQEDFAQTLLQACQDEGIHTAIETNLHVARSVLEKVSLYCDLVMADIKLWDSTAHQAWTGCSNKQIIQNILYLDQVSQVMILRTPLIPGVNMDETTITAIADFAASLKHLLYYELLPYHPLGLGKHAAAERNAEPHQFLLPAREQVEAYARLAAQSGVPVRISGIPYMLENKAVCAMRRR